MSYQVLDGLTAPELRDARRALQEGLLSGIVSISYPAGGAIQYASPAQARLIIGWINDALAALEKPDRYRIRRVRIRSFGLG